MSCGPVPVLAPVFRRLAQVATCSAALLASAHAAAYGAACTYRLAMPFGDRENSVTYDTATRKATFISQDSEKKDRHLQGAMTRYFAAADSAATVTFRWPRPPADGYAAEYDHEETDLVIYFAGVGKGHVHRADFDVDTSGRRFLKSVEKFTAACFKLDQAEDLGKRK
jgi:hypothetical protein